MSAVQARVTRIAHRSLDSCGVARSRDHLVASANFPQEATWMTTEESERRRQRPARLAELDGGALGGALVLVRERPVVTVASVCWDECSRSARSTLSATARRVAGVASTRTSSETTIPVVRSDIARL
jgi:hypothetical protein